MIAFKPALCSVTFRKLGPADIVSLAGKARLTAIEWAGDAHVPRGDMTTADDVGRITREAGLALSYGSYIAPPTDDLAVFRTALDTAARLGTDNIRIWPGARGRDSADYTSEERRATAALIGSMGEEASARGITLSLEYHPNSLTDDTASARDLIETVAQDNVFLYWQPRPGLPLAKAIEEIAIIGEHISHVHVFAWDQARNRYPLATAKDYWREALEAIPPGRWQKRRFAMLEFVDQDDPQAMIADAAILAEILRRR